MSIHHREAPNDEEFPEPFKHRPVSQCAGSRAEDTTIDEAGFAVVGSVEVGFSEATRASRRTIRQRTKPW
jgi:hypothetical protein